MHAPSHTDSPGPSGQCIGPVHAVSARSISLADAPPWIVQYSTCYVLCVDIRWTVEIGPKNRYYVFNLSVCWSMPLIKLSHRQNYKTLVCILSFVLSLFFLPAVWYRNKRIDNKQISHCTCFRWRNVKTNFTLWGRCTRQTESYLKRSVCGAHLGQVKGHVNLLCLKSVYPRYQ